MGREADNTYDDWSREVEYAYDEMSDFENSDWEVYKDGVIDNFHYNKNMGYPEYDNGNYQLQNEIDEDVEEIWNDMPEDEKKWLVDKAKRESVKFIPYGEEVSYNSETGKYEVANGIVAISPEEQKIEVYQPSTKEVVVLATDYTVSAMTGGVCCIEDIEEASVEENYDGSFRTKFKVKAKVGIPGTPLAVPIEPSFEADIEPGTGEVTNVDKPWYSKAIISSDDEIEGNKLPEERQKIGEIGINN